VGDAPAELAAIRIAKGMYSPDGKISAEGAAAVGKVRKATVDLSHTYTNEYVK